MTTTSLSAVLHKVRELQQGVIKSEAVAVDRDYKWPEESLRALQKAGLGGLVVPKELGGMGHGLLALAQVCELIGEVCPSTGLCYGMHCVASAVLAAKATEAQKRDFLEPICAGEHLTTLALSEPGTGAHFYFPQCQLTAHADHFTIRGKKSFVTNGGFADSYVVSTAPADPEAPPDQFSCVVVPATSEGLGWGPEWRGLGMRGNSSRSATLDDVEIPRSYLLGEEGDQIWYVFNVVGPFFFIAMAGTYLGIGSAAIRFAIEHVKNRQYSHSGTSLADVAVVQHRLGVMWAAVERTRAFVYHAASAGDSESEIAPLAIASSKAEVAHCAVDTVNEAMTLTGGISYREGSVLERLARDARAAHVMAPTTDILRTWTGRGLLGQPLLGD